MCDALLPLCFHKTDPLLQESPLSLPSLHVLYQGPQAGPQVCRLLPAASHGVLPDLPPLQQGHESGLVPALQGPHAAAESPLQAEGSPPALADVAHGPGPAGPRDLILDKVQLVLMSDLQLGQLLGQMLEVHLQLLLCVRKDNSEQKNKKIIKINEVFTILSSR